MQDSAAGPSAGTVSQQLYTGAVRGLQGRQRAVVSTDQTR